MKTKLPEGSNCGNCVLRGDKKGAEIGYWCKTQKVDVTAACVCLSWSGSEETKKEHCDSKKGS